MNFGTVLALESAHELFTMKTPLPKAIPLSFTVAVLLLIPVTFVVIFCVIPFTFNNSFVVYSVAV